MKEIKVPVLGTSSGGIYIFFKSVYNLFISIIIHN